MTGQIESKPWFAVAKELQARNGAIGLSLHALEPESQEPDIEWGSRLLEINPQCLLVEKPTTLPDGVRFEVGQTIYVRMALHQMRWELCCIWQQQKWHTLNQGLRVRAYQLSAPSRAVSAQRRGYYRASVAALAMPPVELFPYVADQTSAESLSGEPLKVWPVNISGGGMGVMVNAAELKRLGTTDHFQCHLTLPDSSYAYQLSGHLVYQSPRENGDVYLGIAFEFENEAAEREVVDQLVKFTTWVQRQHLRMLREKK